MDKYLDRTIQKVINQYNKVLGGILIQGVKGCGKTTTCSLLTKSAIYFQDPIKGKNYGNMLLTDSSPFITLEKPTLIDEWQTYPSIWDVLRFDIDKAGDPGMYLLTGSSKAKKNSTHHSGAMRFGKIKTYPLSLYESGHSNGKISLKSLFDNKDFLPCKSDLTIDQIVDRIVIGGWPDLIGKDVEYSNLFLRSFLETSFEQNNENIDGNKKNPVLARKILSSFSKFISTSTSYKTILDYINKDSQVISETTFFEYIEALENLFIVDNIKAWIPKLKTRTTIRTSDNKDFADPSIAVSCLRCTKGDLLNDSHTLESLFKSLVTRDLRVYSSPLIGEVFHYRDRNNLEIDNIIELNDGRWGAVLIKLDSCEFDKAAANLLKLESIVDDSHRKPSFLAIIYGGEYSYKREDGVLVISIGNLKD